jgi:hypothetical protein
VGSKSTAGFEPQDKAARFKLQLGHFDRVTLIQHRFVSVSSPSSGLNLRKETLMMYTNASPTVWLEGSVFTPSSSDSLTKTALRIAQNFTLRIASSSVVRT